MGKYLTLWLVTVSMLTAMSLLAAADRPMEAITLTDRVGIGLLVAACAVWMWCAVRLDKWRGDSRDVLREAQSNYSDLNKLYEDQQDSILRREARAMMLNDSPLRPQAMVALLTQAGLTEQMLRAGNHMYRGYRWHAPSALYVRARITDGLNELHGMPPGLRGLPPEHQRTAMAAGSGQDGFLVSDGRVTHEPEAEPEPEPEPTPPRRRDIG